jgi:hypothetical protein
MKAALVTACLSHLPFHPGIFLGYGTSILASRYDLEVIDLNAECYQKCRRELENALASIDEGDFVSDWTLAPLYHEMDSCIGETYSAVSWEEYEVVYITSPSWFPTVPAEAILRLAGAVRRASSGTQLLFFGNSAGSWTDEKVLRENGVGVVHLNDLFTVNASPHPVRYDELPTPQYSNRDRYLFDLLPFTLKHGCPWGKCRFCSLSKGGNAGYHERSAAAAAEELERLVDLHDSAFLVCRDLSLNGNNLMDFCGRISRLNKTWCGQCRADLSPIQIEALAKAGCRGIYFGAESGSDRTLGVMNKGITAKGMSDFIKRLDGSGVLPAPSFVVGCPGEGTADFDRTIGFLEDHREYLEVVNVYPFMTTPGSEFGSLKKRPNPLVLSRLFRFIKACEELGLKVCLGEQSMEYCLLKLIDRRYRGKGVIGEVSC